MNNDAVIPTWFKVVAGLAIAWNLIGVFAFYSDATMTRDVMTEAQLAFRDSSPGWFLWVYGTAVVAGAFGSVLLLMKHSLSVPILGVSLLAILLQFGYVFGATEVWRTNGVAGIAFPALVVLIGSALLWLSLSAKSRGWFSAND